MPVDPTKGKVGAKMAAAAGASIVGGIGRDKASARVGGKIREAVVNPILGTYTYGLAYAYVPALLPMDTFAIGEAGTTGYYTRLD